MKPVGIELTERDVIEREQERIAAMPTVEGRPVVLSVQTIELPPEVVVQSQVMVNARVKGLDITVGQVLATGSILVSVVNGKVVRRLLIPLEELTGLAVEFLTRDPSEFGEIPSLSLDGEEVKGVPL